MGSVSNYLENAVLDFVLHGSSLSVPTNLYVGLSTADPLDDDSGIAEPSGGSYARVAVNSWAAAASRITAIDAAAVFPTATGAWGTITHWFIADASSGGNILAHGAATTPIVGASGKTIRFPVSQLTVEFLTGGISDFLANKILDHVFKVTPYTPPANTYLGLSTADPLDDASGLAEPVGASYARVLANSWAAASGGVKATSALMAFAAASGSWGTLTHGAIFDAITAGNMLFYAALGAPQAIAAAEYAEYDTGDFSITLT